MGQAVSRGQALQISARVGTQVNWDELDGVSLQNEVIELTPEEFGARFTAFLRNGARLVVGVLKAVINRSEPFDPTFVGNGWTIWKGSSHGTGLKGDLSQDARSLALSEIDVNQVRLVTTLKLGESSIKGEERLTRLRATGQILLDAAVFLHFWKNQHLIPEAWKERVDGNIRYIYFDGTILRNPNGNRYVLYLCWDVGRWYWNVSWLDDEFNARSVSAVLAG